MSDLKVGNTVLIYYVNYCSMAECPVAAEHKGLIVKVSGYQNSVITIELPGKAYLTVHKKQCEKIDE